MTKINILIIDLIHNFVIESLIYEFGYIRTSQLINHP